MSWDWMKCRNKVSHCCRWRLCMSADNLVTARRSPTNPSWINNRLSCRRTVRLGRVHACNLLFSCHACTSDGIHRNVPLRSMTSHRSVYCRVSVDATSRRCYFLDAWCVYSSFLQTSEAEPVIDFWMLAAFPGWYLLYNWMPLTIGIRKPVSNKWQVISI